MTATGRKDSPQMSFMTQAELKDVRDTMETWSQLCLEGLSKMVK
jgi:predicted NUDIX family phosphoesterase